MELHHLGYCVRNNLQSSISELEYLGFEKMVEVSSHPVKNMDIIYLSNGIWRIELMIPTNSNKESPLNQPLGATKANIMNYHCGYSIDDTSKTMRKLITDDGYSIISNVTDGWLPCVRDLKIANMKNFKNGLGQVELMGSNSSEDFVE